MAAQFSSTKALQCCGYFLYWLPRLAALGTIVWGIISHINYASQISNFFLRYLLLISGAFCGVCAAVAYFRTFNEGPGSPREFLDFYVGDDAECQAGFDESTVPPILEQAIEAKGDGGVRFCSKCHVFKPDRTHHCRQCGICVLRMDHHCIWFSACIGLKNHKYFLQSLVYISLLCIIAFVTAFPLMLRFFAEQSYENEFLSLNFVFYAFISAAFTVILPFFTIYSLYNAAINRTTLESMEPGAYRTTLPANKWRYRHPPTRDNLGNVYDVGVVENLNQVMGHTWPQWILPIKVKLSLNGSYFPVNEELRTKAEERAKTEIAMHVRRQQFYEQQQQENRGPTYLPAS